MKWFLSIFLTLVMLFSVCPSIFAAEGDEVEYSTDGESSWTTVSFDEAWTAVTKANTTAEIKILKNIEINQTKEFGQTRPERLT